MELYDLLTSIWLDTCIEELDPGKYYLQLYITEDNCLSFDFVEWLGSDCCPECSNPNQYTLDYTDWSLIYQTVVSTWSEWIVYEMKAVWLINWVQAELEFFALVDPNTYEIISIYNNQDSESLWWDSTQVRIYNKSYVVISAEDSWRDTISFLVCWQLNDEETFYLEIELSDCITWWPLNWYTFQAYDATTGQPMGWDYSWTTNFAWSSLVAGNYNITISAPWYVTQTFPVTVSINERIQLCLNPV